MPEPTEQPNDPDAMPAQAPHLADEATALAHEVRDIVDGSLRWLALASTALDGTAQSSPDIKPGDTVDEARRQIASASDGLLKIAELVEGAMRGGVPPMGGPTMRVHAPAALPDTGAPGWISLASAIRHATELITPAARTRRVVIELALDPAAEAMPAGPLYLVVLNGLRNALESIAAASAAYPSTGTGLIDIIASVDPDSRGAVSIEIHDDGLGPPATRNARRVFEPGFTTKPGAATGLGLGLGLAIASGIVNELDGTISLERRRDDPVRPGATLRIGVPTRSIMPSESGAA
ncbi:MAG: ATP-binding protein [Planctomycetota bacterium]